MGLQILHNSEVKLPNQKFFRTYVAKSAPSLICFPRQTIAVLTQP